MTGGTGVASKNGIVRRVFNGHTRNSGRSSINRRSNRAVARVLAFRAARRRGRGVLHRAPGWFPAPAVAAPNYGGRGFGPGRSVSNRRPGRSRPRRLAVSANKTPIWWPIFGTSARYQRRVVKARRPRASDPSPAARAVGEQNEVAIANRSIRAMSVKPTWPNACGDMCVPRDAVGNSCPSRGANFPARAFRHRASDQRGGVRRNVAAAPRGAEATRANAPRRRLYRTGRHVRGATQRRRVVVVHLSFRDRPRRTSSGRAASARCGAGLQVCRERERLARGGRGEAAANRLEQLIQRRAATIGQRNPSDEIG